MKSPKSEAESRRRKVGTIGGTVRPLIATIKQTLVTMPGINRLVPGGRKPVTHLYPYQKVELPLAYRGQHSIDWFKCIGCELCAKVCPNECIYFEFYEVEPTSEYLHPSRAQLDEMKKIIRRPERPEGQADRHPGVRLHEVHRLPTMRRRLPGRLPAHGRNRVQGPRRFLPYQPPRGSQAPGGTGRKVGPIRPSVDYSQWNCRPFILFPSSMPISPPGRPTLGRNDGRWQLPADWRKTGGAVPSPCDRPFRQRGDRRGPAANRGTGGRQGGPARAERGGNRRGHRRPDFVVRQSEPHRAKAHVHRDWRTRSVLRHEHVLPSADCARSGRLERAHPRGRMEVRPSELEGARESHPDRSPHARVPCG